MLRNYFDLHMTSNHSFGTNTVEEMVMNAEKLNLHTIAIVDHLEDKREIDILKKEIASVKTPVKVLVGIELKADTEADIKMKINKFRDLVDILVVSGGTVEVNKAAVEDSRVDILAHPEFKRRDSGLDHTMAEAAAKNLVAIELNFREYLHTYRKLRSHVLNHMRRNVMLCQKFNAPIIVTSAAESIWDLRSGRELASLAYICGMTREDAVNTVTVIPEQIVARVKKIKSPEYIAPGIEVKE